jgi:hypothetical protein
MSGVFRKAHGGPFSLGAPSSNEKLGVFHNLVENANKKHQPNGPRTLQGLPSLQNKPAALAGQKNYATMRCWGRPGPPKRTHNQTFALAGPTWSTNAVLLTYTKRHWRVSICFGGTDLVHQNAHTQNNALVGPTWPTNYLT